MASTGRVAGGLLLILVGLVIILVRKDLGRSQQNSDMPFKKMRQGPGWLRVAVLNQLLAGVVFIVVGAAILLGAPMR